MGKAAAATKQFMQVNENFADALNYRFYKGKQRVRPENLKELDASEVSMIYGEKKNTLPVERVRDVMKQLTLMSDEQAVYAIIGIENQTDVHYAMPVRNMIYDALAYAGQITRVSEKHRIKKEYRGQSSGEYLSGFLKDDRLLPVITLVIYFGAEEWDAPISLHEMFGECDPELLQYAADYQVQLILPQQLQEEEFELFQSDLREVLSFIKCSGDKGQLQKLMEQNPKFASMSHLAVQVLNECVNAGIKMSQEKEETDVCKAFDDMRMEGKIEKLAEQICRKLRKNKSLSCIAEELEEEVEQIRPIYEIAVDLAPEYDIKQVLQKLSA